MRRTTLGPVSASNMNSRLSMGVGPTRMAPPSNKIPSHNSFSQKDRRASATPMMSGGGFGGGGVAGAGPGGIGGGAGGRRSSTMNGNPRSSMAYGNRPGAKQDPRPLSDRTYMNTCIRDLICYLTENGFDQALSPKILTNPTSKDFQNIFLFLVRQIDPAFQFEKKFEEDVPAFLKALGYPVNISKTALQAVGSPHTWPALLASLTWILELLTYDEVAALKKRENADMDAEAASNRMFFDYLVRTYDAFLSGNDDFDGSDNELANSFQQRDQIIQQEINQLTASNERMKQQIEDYKTRENPVIHLNQKKIDYMSDIEKFNKLIDQLSSHIDMLEKKSVEKKQELESQTTALEQAKETKLMLQNTIAVQESNAIDAKRITRDRENLKKALAKTAEQRDMVEKKQNEANALVAERTGSLEEQLHHYHAAAENLYLIPATARNANGVQFRVTLSRNLAVTKAEEMLSIDLKNDVKPALIELKDAFLKTIIELQDESLEVREIIDTAEEGIMIKRQEISSLETRLKKLELQYKEEREAIAEYLKETSASAFSLEEEIQNLKRKNEEKLRISQKTVENLHIEYRRLREKYEKEREECNENLLEAVQLLTDHKAHIQEKTYAIKEHIENMVEAMQNVELENLVSS